MALKKAGKRVEVMPPSGLQIFYLVCPLIHMAAHKTQGCRTVVNELFIAGLLGDRQASRASQIPEDWELEQSQA